MSSPPREQVRELLSRIDEAAAAPADLLPLVYDELRRLARAYLRHERADCSLQATGLVHEAYLRLVDQQRVAWRGRQHFFAVGAQMMRRLLIDHARRKGSVKRGGDWLRVSFEGREILDRPCEPLEVLALDRALRQLAALDPRAVQVVELRFFAGLDVEEVAAMLGVSRRTVEGDWTHARAWLRRALAGEVAGDSAAAAGAGTAEAEAEKA